MFFCGDLVVRFLFRLFREAEVEVLEDHLDRAVDADLGRVDDEVIVLEGLPAAPGVGLVEALSCLVHFGDAPLRLFKGEERKTNLFGKGKKK